MRKQIYKPVAIYPLVRLAPRNSQYHAQLATLEKYSHSEEYPFWQLDFARRPLTAVKRRWISYASLEIESNFTFLRLSSISNSWSESLNNLTTKWSRLSPFTVNHRLTCTVSLVKFVNQSKCSLQRKVCEEFQLTNYIAQHKLLPSINNAMTELIGAVFSRFGSPYNCIISPALK